MKQLLGSFLSITMLTFWIAGIVIAKGFWSTFFSIVLFPYSWYLVIELVMIRNGILS